MKKVSILQSNYIPWKGYFDLIAAVDEFVIYDDMQFTKNDWRNRNQIKTPKGLEWLSIPVGSAINRKIKDVPLPSGQWQIKHLKTLQNNYGRARCYNEIIELITPVYQDQTIATLTGFNAALIKVVCGYLNIKTKISFSWDYEIKGDKTERLVNLCRQTQATTYVSGLAAKAYLDETMFSDQGIEVLWFDYANYPEHPQLWGKFVHNVSIVDLLFNCGKSSPHYMKLIKN